MLNLNTHKSPSPRVPGVRWGGVGCQRRVGSGGAIGPHAHGNAARHVADDLNAEGSGQQKP